MSGIGKREDEEGRRRERLDAEHQPPRQVPGRRLGDQVVGEERQQDAEDDVELGERHQAPADRAGEISAMYIGETTDAPPTPMPPRKRKNRNEYQSHARLQPSAERK